MEATFLCHRAELIPPVLSIVQFVELVAPSVRESGKRPLLLSILTPLSHFLSLV